MCDFVRYFLFSKEAIQIAAHHKRSVPEDCYKSQLNAEMLLMLRRLKRDCSGVALITLPKNKKQV